MDNLDVQKMPTDSIPEFGLEAGRGQAFSRATADELRLNPRPFTISKLVTRRRYGMERFRFSMEASNYQSMFAIRLLSNIALICFATVSSARDITTEMASAQEKYGAGDFDSALEMLEPLLQADDLDQPSKQRVLELAIRALHSRGEEHFRHARIAESIADFDREVQLQPNRAAEHWQRGIAYYYAGEFEKGSAAV